MCRALTKTSTHFNTRTARKNQSNRYPNSAPPREEKTSSPEPMVSEAITAPGPNTVTQASGLRDCKARGSGVEPQPSSAFGSVLTSPWENRGQWIRNGSPSRARLVPPNRRLQRPGLLAGDLQDLRRPKAFLVDDPTAEQFGRVPGDTPGRQ